MMTSDDLERLRPIGLTAQHCAQAAMPLLDAGPGAGTRSPVLMRISGLHRDSIRLHDGAETHSATLAPRLARHLAENGEAATVGDWVRASRDGNGRWQAVQRLLPLNCITRRDAHGQVHAIVSNVETALLTMGLDGDFSVRRIERFITLARHSGVRPVVVLTKADTVVNAQTLFARQRIVRERIGTGIALLCVDARDADTALRLRPHLESGSTLVLLGSSGAGKSTLVNTLAGRVVQDTGAVRRHDSRGQHTTRSRALICLPDGGCVIDTPGLRALRADAGEADVAAAFVEIADLATGCRFRDCRHRDEPGCLVRQTVDADRLTNYHKLLREARADSISQFERRRLLASYKARTRERRARERGEAGGLR